MDTGKDTKDFAKDVVTELLRSEEFKCTFKQLVSETLDEQFTKLNVKIDAMKMDFDEKIDKLRTECNESIEKLKGEVHDVSVDHSKLEEETTELEAKVNTNIGNVNMNYYKIMDLKQDSLKNTVQITGVPETAVKKDQETGRATQEDTEKVVMDVLSQTGVELENQDIDFARRIKKPKHLQNTATPRPIEVKFTRRSTKQKIIQKRRLLKGTGIGVHEQLCYQNQVIYNEARKLEKSMDKIKAVWIWDCTVVLLTEVQGLKTKYRVRSLEKLKEIERNYGQSS